VVNISTKTLPKKNRDEQGSPNLQFPPGSQLDDLFRDFLERQGRGAQRPSQSLGSGFVIDPAGLVVTNNHVIQDADQITVRFPDGTELPAELIGRDAKVDLALLKVKSSKPLPSVPWGDSDKARVGDSVIAVGNPFGLGGSVTAGIISSRNRELGGSYDDFIQTDAAINQGNSGGPLFNMNGEVVGINSAILSGGGGGSIGIGFSIPSKMARTIVDQLRQFGEIRRGWLGVSIGIVEKEMAEAMGLDKARGALVQTVNDGGPAVNAGIKPGDIILKFDGRDVPDNRSLPRMVAETPIGKKVAVDLFRNGQAKSVTLEVGRLPDDPGKPSKPDSKGDKGDANTELASLGLRLAPLSPALRQKFNVPAEVKSGLVVVDVDVAKPAGEKLRPGDVIVEAQSKETTSVAALAERIKELESQSKKAIVLRVVRENPTPIFVAINIEKK
jgi:serine protease Do